MSFFLPLLPLMLAAPAPPQPLVIAHRGASGYLPEHTLEAKSLAHQMGADYLEQDLVMSKDDRLVVLHDRYLDRVSDVATVFPGRARKDGRYYAIDFTLAEMRTLRVTEGFKLDADGKQVAVFPGRYPLWKGRFAIHTFAEELELIQGLNRTTGRTVGIYPEIKAPWFHRREGKDISVAALAVLQRYGYTDRAHQVFLQCFDPNELRRIAGALMPAQKMNVKLVQLIAENDWGETMEKGADGRWVNYDYGWMHQPGGMAKVAEYAQGVGPWKPMVVSERSTRKKRVFTGLVKAAHAAGLKVHAYTFRADEGRVPAYARDFEDMVRIFVQEAGVDGVFSDFPDRALKAISRGR
jgi:glycerophosphoryl diester phosphodiesterase